MKTLKTQVPDNIKQAFKRRSKRKDMSESELLRSIVVAELSKARKGGIDAADDSDPSDDESTRINVRLPKFMRDEVDRRRKKTGGLARSTWIRALIQSNLLRTPVVTEEEIIALATSNRQLAAIGRNLNQIARALNLAYHETERIKIEQIETLIAVTEAHRKTVAALISAAESRWSADE